MPSPGFEEGQAPRPEGGTPRTLKNAALLDQRCADHETTHFRTLLHASRPTAKRADHNLITHDHPQACEPRCADVFKHYLACADRIEQKGAGAGAASLNTNPPSHAIAATTQKKRAGDCEPYYFDWLKCIDKCAMPHIMQKLK